MFLRQVLHIQGATFLFLSWFVESSPPPPDDIKSGEVLWSTKHFWSFTVKQSCSVLLNIHTETLWLRKPEVTSGFQTLRLCRHEIMKRKSSMNNCVKTEHTGRTGLWGVSVLCVPHNVPDTHTQTHTLMECQMDGCQHHYTSLWLITCPTGSFTDSLDWVTASSSAQWKLDPTAPDTHTHTHTHRYRHTATHTHTGTVTHTYVNTHLSNSLRSWWVDAEWRRSHEPADPPPVDTTGVEVP